MILVTNIWYFLLLVNAAYPALKSMPVGSVCDSLPYLSRRAQENSAITGGATEERQLVKTELLQRLRLRS